MRCTPEVRPWDKTVTTTDYKGLSWGQVSTPTLTQTKETPTAHVQEQGRHGTSTNSLCNDCQNGNCPGHLLQDTNYTIRALSWFLLFNTFLLRVFYGNYTTMQDNLDLIVLECFTILVGLLFLRLFKSEWIQKVSFTLNALKWKASRLWICLYVSKSTWIQKLFDLTRKNQQFFFFIKNIA